MGCGGILGASKGKQRNKNGGPNMKAGKGLRNFEHLENKYVGRDGLQTYTEVVNESGQLLAHGLADKAAQNEWIWVHRNFKKNPR